MPLLRFRRVDIRNLRVGDSIRCKAIYQSQTGYLAKIAFRGQIVALTSLDTPYGRPAFVQGMLRDDDGTVRTFKVTDQDRVYRRAGKVPVVVPGVLVRESELGEGHAARATEG
jgi:hypothetical protein